jgi:hypothetical protein
MKTLARLPWSYGAILSLSWLYSPGFKPRSFWRHTPVDSFHLVRWKLGRVSLLRIRQTANHARRLGLPIV